MNNLSLLEVGLGRYDEALLWATRSFPLCRAGYVAYYHVGIPLIFLGDDATTLRWLVEAERRYPKEPRIKILLAMLDAIGGKLQSALERGHRLLDIQPDNQEGKDVLCELTFLAGTPDAERKAEQAFLGNPEITADFWLVMESPRMRYAHLLAVRGDRVRAVQLAGEARMRAEKVVKDGNQSPRVPFEIAAAHCLLRENEAALSWLERAYYAGLRDYRTLAIDPLFQTLRSDPRFQAILRRMSVDIAEMRRRADIARTLPVTPPG